ncbi:hypothetical protein [Bordetella genomosp. 9]|uniref:Uncharacterized protein n=1 Tax=Bordetella genomosp. 9 TaxID=1416803 RepID=A0A1W6Z4H3_9BORD|nr:hypothetical protein [Bordetella genomosp. 9]ARP88161.1 hypothetical protein CAL13_19525 [Bordetella genomosp. 9]
MRVRQTLARRGREYGERLRARGGRVDNWRLAGMGVTGNSHMLMMDDNSDDIAARISAWIVAQAA